MTKEIKTFDSIEQELKQCENLNQVAKVMGISYYALNQMIEKIGVSKEDYLNNIEDMHVELHGKKHFHPRSIVGGGRLPRELSATFIEVVRNLPIEKRGEELLKQMKEKYEIEINPPSSIEFNGAVFESLQDFANRFELSERELRYITGRKGITDSFQEDIVNYFANEGREKFLCYMAGEIIDSKTMNPSKLVSELSDYGFIEKPSTIPAINFISAIVNAHRHNFDYVFKKGSKISLLNMNFDSLEDMLDRLSISPVVFTLVSTQVKSLTDALSLSGPYKKLFEENPTYVNGVKFKHPIEVAPYLSISMEKFHELLENGTNAQFAVTQFALTDSTKIKLKDESSEIRSQLTDAKSYFSSIGVPFALALKIAKKLDKSISEVREMLQDFEIEIEGSTLRTFNDIHDVFGVDFEKFVVAVNEVKDIQDSDERCFAFIEKCI